MGLTAFPPLFLLALPVAAAEFDAAGAPADPMAAAEWRANRFLSLDGARCMEPMQPDFPEVGNVNGPAHDLHLEGGSLDQARTRMWLTFHSADGSQSHRPSDRLAKSQDNRTGLARGA